MPPTPHYRSDSNPIQILDWNRGFSRSRGWQFCYDANGNVLNDGRRFYTWTAENQPASVAPVGGTTETYTYDADGERVAKTVGGVTTPADESAGWHPQARSSGLPARVASLRAQTPQHTATGALSACCRPGGLSRSICA